MSKSNKPAFQTQTQKSFQEKRRQPFGEKAAVDKPRNRPSFSRKNSDNETNEPRELSLNKAGGKGSVAVTFKGSANTSKVKKTGPLSPRAPEKIKKNRAEEMKVYGEEACLALFAERPQAIVRLWATVAMSHKIGELLSYLAANKKAYHIVDNEEMALVSGSEHHGGICLLVKKSRPLTLTGYLEVAQPNDCLLLLDRINNAQNLGGILRTAAFYGVKHVISDSPDSLYAPAAWRVAEGGAEYVRVLHSLSTETALIALREAGYQIVHIANGEQSVPLDQLKLGAKVVFVLSENSSDDFIGQNDSQVRLSLRNPLKHGLNVAVNTGILLAKWYF